MKAVEITPNVLEGTIAVPPSKSMAHRGIICAALAKGVSKIEHVDLSDDILVTIKGMEALGAKIEIDHQTLTIDGTNTLSKKDITIDCNESGSTLRFLVPISLITPNKVRFIGRGNLGKRPLTTYYRMFKEQKITYSTKEDQLDLVVEGKLQGGTFWCEGNISSQFISGLLFTLPLLEEDSILHLTTPLESKGYIDLTLSALKQFGIEVENKDNLYRTFLIKGNQCYRPSSFDVEGDYSQGAFYLVAGALGSKVVTKGLEEQSLQGDKACVKLLEEMGAQMIRQDNALQASAQKLKAHEIDARQYPDIIPIMVVACALSEGESRIINGERLRIKECDRLQAIAVELNRLGACIEVVGDTLIIQGVPYLTGGIVHSHHDHRIAMSLAIAATRCKEKVVLEAPGCVSKSYPYFWDDYKSLGGKFRWIEEVE